MSAQQNNQRTVQSSWNPSANAGTTRIVKEYVKRVESHDLEEYPEWDVKVCIEPLVKPQGGKTYQ